MTVIDWWDAFKKGRFYLGFIAGSVATFLIGVGLILFFTDYEIREFDAPLLHFALPDRSEQDFQAVHEQLATTQVERDDARIKLSAREKDIAALKQQIASTTSPDELLALQSEAESLRKQLASSTEALEQKSAAAIALENRIKKLEADLQSSDIETMRSELATLRKQKEESDAQIAGLNQKLVATSEALDAATKKISAFEARSAEANAEDGTVDSAGSPSPIAKATILDVIVISLDYASVVDETQLLLEYSIVNQGSVPLLAILAAFQDSSISLRGEAKPRQFRVNGLAATCPTYQTRVTQNCMKLVPDEQWTLLEPQVPYQFQISTDARLGKIKSTAAAARVRMLIREGDKARFQDVSFAQIPLAK